MFAVGSPHKWRQRQKHLSGEPSIKSVHLTLFPSNHTMFVQEHEARRLATLRAKRFGPQEDSGPKPPTVADADLLGGRQSFPSFQALPPTATASLPSSASSAHADPPATYNYMVCTPLATVDEVWEWTPAPSPALAPRAFIPPYVPPPRTAQHELLRRGRLLVCHDMKGAFAMYVVVTRAGVCMRRPTLT
jgi:hypothetical protein